MFLLMFKLGILHSACVSITSPPNYPNTAYRRHINIVREEVMLTNGIFIQMFINKALCTHHGSWISENVQKMYCDTVRCSETCHFLCIKKNLTGISPIVFCSIVYLTILCQIKHMRWADGRVIYSITTYANKLWQILWGSVSCSLSSLLPSVIFKLMFPSVWVHYNCFSLTWVIFVNLSFATQQDT